jgi:hypothetical protein
MAAVPNALPDGEYSRARRGLDGAGIAPVIEARPGRAQLRVVAPQRRAARLITVLAALIATSMLASAAFQATLAPRQARIDDLDRAIREQRTEHGELRRNRAELRAPGRLAAEAIALGMGPSSTTTFLTITPEVVAAIQRSAGVAAVVSSTDTDVQFELVGDIKAATPEPGP